MQIVTVAQMREIERTADADGLSYAQMMQNAGEAAAAVIRQRMQGWSAGWSGDRPARVLILAGPGNNGGDGLVCASALHDAAATPAPGDALTVQVFLLKARAQDDPVYTRVLDRGIFVADADNDMRLRVLHQMVTHADVVVDALLGTGVSRPIDGLLAEILGQVRAVTDRSAAQRQPIVVALDGVTGMNYDTGGVDPQAVSSDLAITFHAPKRGHYCYPAAAANGELVVVPIGIERVAAVASIAGNVQLADFDLVRSRLPDRTPDSNKGSFGKVLVIGGCSDYAGAPALAATAAYRVGTGLVTLSVPRSIQTSVAASCREATFATLEGTADCLNPAALPRIMTAVAGLDARHAIVIGPGMGQDPATRALLFGLLEQLGKKPGGARLVIDADALNLLAALPDWPGLLPPRSILTPHPGEMARLTGSTIKAIQSDRIANALSFSERWCHIVVLKGAYSVVADPEMGGMVLPYANSALAVAGTGDVLAGCIAGMLSQGLSSYDAAVCGADLHARAGELWRQQHGDAGLLASDLLPLLPDVLAAVRQARSG